MRNALHILNYQDVCHESCVALSLIGYLDMLSHSRSGFATWLKLIRVQISKLVRDVYHFLNQNRLHFFGYIYLLLSVLNIKGVLNSSVLGKGKMNIHSLKSGQAHKRLDNRHFFWRR